MIINKIYKRIPLEAVSKERKSMFCHPERSELSSAKTNSGFFTPLRSIQNDKFIIFIIISLSFAISFLTSCGDSPTVDYIPRNYVQGVLFVDSTISQIIVMQTQPMSDSLNNRKGQITDADVRIYGDNAEFKLYYQDNPMGFYYPDTTYKVKPNTHYQIKVTLKDGTVITGETTTPTRFQWAVRPKDYIYYPKDTINLPYVDSISISWTDSNVPYYLLRVTCLDTTNYGKYLIPPTMEKNRRNSQNLETSDMPTYNDLTRWGGPIPQPNVPVVWMSFKWYGLHDVTIVAPDSNYYKWFNQYQRSGSYDPHYSNITNGIGNFASASQISATFFLIKNQP